MRNLTLKTVIFITIILLSFGITTKAQVWSGSLTTDATSHLGYATLGGTSSNSLLNIYGENWSNFIRLTYRKNTSNYAQIGLGSDGMLFRNYNPSGTYAYSFRDNNDVKILTLYRNGKVAIGSSYTVATATKLRVFDAVYPSMQVASSTATGDLSIATGQGYYCLFSNPKDLVLRAESGDLILTSNYSTGKVLLGTGNGSTAKMVITSTGEVGIGTTTPSTTYKLSVKGKIRAEEIKVETGWSDFVFNPDYKLPSLYEVETFINQNGHLPEIPSAEEVKEKGVSVGEMQSKLLQKIEELTLYIIEQNKTINEQNKRIEKLEKQNSEESIN